MTCLLRARREHFAGMDDDLFKPIGLSAPQAALARLAVPPGRA
ncbi:MAG: hypothetical protein Q8R98_21405 [Rubrivivax sp.]|nr:hypothetical protein [Rubrivivax sp.]MDP3225493.1 hypothetical protein [Rubrivivax sp.]MDP3614408.1 hypothetical protein [Rubrivivax sp.]